MIAHAHLVGRAAGQLIAARRRERDHGQGREERRDVRPLAPGVERRVQRFVGQIAGRHARILYARRVFGWLTERRRRKLADQPFPQAWEDILTADVAIWRKLDDVARERLRDL